LPASRSLHVKDMSACVDGSRTTDWPASAAGTTAMQSRIAFFHWFIFHWFILHAKPVKVEGETAITLSEMVWLTAQLTLLGCRAEYGAPDAVVGVCPCVRGVVGFRKSMVRCCTF